MRKALSPRSLLGAFRVFSGVAGACQRGRRAAPAGAAPRRAQPARAGAAAAAGMTEDEAAPPAEPTPRPQRRSRARRSPGDAGVSLDAPERRRKKPPRARTHAEHVVAAHETLGGIAHHYGISTDALAAANGITRITPIRVGQHLVIPAPGETVTRPDAHSRRRSRATRSAGSRVATACTSDAILAANHLKKHERLHLGQKLVIPGGARVPGLARRVDGRTREADARGRPRARRGHSGAADPRKRAGLLLRADRCRAAPACGP